MVMVMMVVIRECTCLLRIWEVVVCIATNYRLADPGFESWQRKRFFSSPKPSRMALGPSHYSLSTWGLFSSQW